MRVGFITEVRTFMDASELAAAKGGFSRAVELSRATVDNYLEHLEEALLVSASPLSLAPQQSG